MKYPMRGLAIQNPQHALTTAVKSVMIDRTGELSEWLKEPVLKTGDSARNREFESHTLRQKKCRLWAAISFGGECEDSKIKSKLPVAAWSPTAGRRRTIYFLRSRKCKRISTLCATNERQISYRRKIYLKCTLITKEMPP